MTRRADQLKSSGSRFERLLDEIQEILGDPGDAAALADLVSGDPAAAGRIGRKLSGVLSELDNSGSNPKLGGVWISLNAWLADAYGATESYFVEGGSSNANVRVALSTRKWLATANLPAKVIVDRNAHASVIGACAIAGLDALFVYRDYLPELDITRPPSSTQIEEQLKATGAKAVWIVAPTYDGFCPDLAAIASVCRKYGALLLIDAAWGALHGMHQCGPFPESAMECGADVSVVSLHKKGLGLSQSSVANFKNPMFARFFRQVSDLGLATTSPLYLLPASTQVGLEAIFSEAGSNAWRSAADAAKQFRVLVDGYRGCKAIRAEDLGPGIVGDPCHVLINVRKAGVSGFQILHAFGGFDNDLEMATRDTVLLLFGPEHGRSAIELANLFRRAIDTAELGLDHGRLAVPLLRPPRAMSLQEALMAPSEQVLLPEAVGRVAAQTVGAYPPGQAIVCLGEEITREVLDYLFAVERAGGRLKGLAGPLHATPIEVVM